MARVILAIPLATIASKFAFSVGGKVLDAFRSSLKLDIVEGVIYLRDWLFGQGNDFLSLVFGFIWFLI